MKTKNMKKKKWDPSFVMELEKKKKRRKINQKKFKLIHRKR